MNITEILNELGIPYKQQGEHHHTTTGWVQVDCPNCSPNSQKWNLGIALNFLASNCWVCGPVSLSEALVEISKEPWQKIKQLLGGFERTYERKIRVKGKLKLPEGLGPLLPIHESYLSARGYNPEELTRLWGIQGIGLASKLAWRLFLPVQYRGEIVSWTTRAVADDVDRKYINARPEEENLPIKSILFGWDYIRHAAIVVEGPFDAITLGPGAVATLGTSYTREQVLLLSSLPVRAICFDNEPEAQKRAKALCEELQAFDGETYRVEIDAKDPGCASKKQIAELRKRFLE